MKAITKTITVVLLITISLATYAQRTITGIVYNNGEPAAGILVEANRTSDSYFTGFDGKYEIKVSEKTKFIRFSFLENSRKVDLATITSDEFNYSWDGSELPDANAEPGVILKSLDQLQKDGDSEFLNNYSLYREFLKQDDFNSALPYWRIVFKYYPKSTTQIYMDGLKIMDAKMNQAMMTDNKKAYLDTMMQIYDKRIKYFDSKGELLGRKAAKYLETVLTFDINQNELIEDIKRGYGYAEHSIAESGIKTEPAVLVLYMQSTRRLYSFNEFNQTTVLENYENTISLLDKQLRNEETKAKAEQALPLIEQIIESSGALDCESMLKLYAPKFKENPNDVEQIKKMLRMFRKNNCDNDLVVKLSEKQYQLEPSPEAAFNMARMFFKKNDNKRAFEYYEKAYSEEKNNEIKASYYYEAAGLALQNDMLQKARDLAKEALKNKPDYCEVYLLLGEIYAQASKTYSDDDFERSTVFWVAVDFFQKAANFDNCKTDGLSKVKFYTNYFPSKDEAFFRSLIEGQNHFVSGWINETTKIRVK